MKCLYCPTELDASTARKRAHIIPESLGGRLASPPGTAVCDECNNDMGNTIEKSVAGHFRSFMASIGAVDGQGNPTPPASVEVSDRATMKLHGGELRTEKARSPEVIEADGRFSVTFTGSDPDRLADQVVDRLLQKELSPDDLEEGVKAALVIHQSEQGQRVELGTFDFLVQSEEHDRVVTKIALELLAHPSARPELARRPELKSARDFARHGSRPAPSVTIDPFCTSLVVGDDQARFAHVVEVCTVADGPSSKSDLLVARVVLFGFWTYFTALVRGWRGDPIVLHHVVDPVDGVSNGITASPFYAPVPAGARLWRPRKVSQGDLDSISEQANAAQRAHIESTLAKKRVGETPPPPDRDDLYRRIRSKYEARVAAPKAKGRR